MTEKKPIPLTLKLDHRGRALIPLDVRRAWNLKENDFIIIELQAKV
jgi:bifunctional DNA-binding transcriptional regulator/antitoxin component of YhaV-PrlF toxin-antitoxin module